MMRDDDFMVFVKAGLAVFTFVLFFIVCSAFFP